MPHGHLDFDSRYRASTYRGTIRFHDIYEPYMPDRVARQFARVQSRPLDPIRPHTVSRRASIRGMGAYKVEFEAHWDGWDRLDEHICAELLSSPSAVADYDMDEEYLDWFLPISHPYVRHDATEIPHPRRHAVPVLDASRV